MSLLGDGVSSTGMTFFQRNRISFSLLFLGAILFLPGLGQVHLFDWDEVNFAEVSREMMVLDNYSQPHVWFLPFWQKPPLFFWLQVLAMKMFGVNEFAARFPNAICGIITIPLLFHIGRKLYDEKFGLIWALAYMGSLLPNLYFQSGIIDPVFNLFIFLAFWSFIRFVWKKEGEAHVNLFYGPYTYLLMSGAWTGLAVLTKGPAALIILCLVFFIYWLYRKFKLYISIPQFLFYLVATVLISGIWYITETLLHGSWFIKEFLTYNYQLFSTEDAGHGGFPGYHFVVVLIGCFPCSVFLLNGLFQQNHSHAYQKDMKRWMLMMMWTVLILFSVVQSKIIHYSSMTYFPVTYLTALVLYESLLKKKALPFGIAAGTGLVAAVFGIALIALPWLGLHIEWLQERTSDVFAKANMEADAGWTGWEALAGIMLIGSSITGLILMRRTFFEAGIAWLFLGAAFSFKLAMLMDVPKVEAYSQRAAIEFFEELKGEDVYLQAIGYKTYADLFYAQLQPENKPKVLDYTDREQKANWEKWLLEGPIDKPVYFITRVDKKTVLEEKKDIFLVDASNGFLLYKRIPEY